MLTSTNMATVQNTEVIPGKLNVVTVCTVRNYKQNWAIKLNNYQFTLPATLPRRITDTRRFTRNLLLYVFYNIVLSENLDMLLVYIYTYI
jgi:hypothetical protein